MKVLLIEDEQRVASFIRKGLEEHNIQVAQAFDGPMGMKLALSDAYDVIILDIVMPGMSGLELQAKLKTLGSRLPIIFITAQGDGAMKTQAVNAGAVEVLSKPFDDEVLLEKVRASMRS